MGAMATCALHVDEEFGQVLTDLTVRQDSLRDSWQILKHVNLTCKKQQAH